MPSTSPLHRPLRSSRFAPVVTGIRPATEPRIQYARSEDGIDIAYYSLGSGDPLIALPGGGGLSHLAREWQYPEQRAWVQRLAQHHRVIRLDHRGTGLSDRNVPFDLNDAALDIEAVAEREGLSRFALFGQLHTAGTAILYAARHPERVSHLVLWSPIASYREFLESSPPMQAARAAAAKDWATYTELVAQVASGWSDPVQARRFAAYLRECVPAAEYVSAMERFIEFDVSALLGALTMPVLILHRRESVLPSLDVVSKIAGEMPASSRLVVLAGSAVVPFLGDLEEVYPALDEFLSATHEHGRPNGLTEREQQILARLAAGESNKEIARALLISTRTVERHIANVYNKIGAHNRAQATAYAFRHGIGQGE